MVLAGFLWQFRVRPLQRYPGWDLYWADTLVAGKISNIRSSFAAGELPALSSYVAFGHNTAGDAKALTSYFTPLLPAMLLTDPGVLIELRYALFLFLGLVGCYWFLRQNGASISLAATGAAFYVFLPAHFCNEQYYFCLSFFLLPLLIQVQIRWIHTGNSLWLSVLGLVGVLAYSSADVYFLVIILPLIFLTSMGTAIRLRRLGRFVWGCFVAVACAAFYIVPLLSNLLESRSYQAEIGRFGATSAPNVSSWHEFWSYFQEVGLPSFFLPQQSTALFLYIPSFLVFLSMFLLIAGWRKDQKAEALLSAGLLVSGVSMLAVSFAFYLLPAEIVQSAKGVLRYHINLWPYAVILSIFVSLAHLQENRRQILQVVAMAVVAGFIVDFMLFVPDRPTPGYGAIVGDWFHIKHRITLTVDSVNQLKLPSSSDLWPWLPWLNLCLGAMVIAGYVAAKRPLASGIVVACAVVCSGLYITYHNELRNTQQSGWQILGRSSFHIDAFQQRRADLLKLIPPDERKQFRVLPASADVFRMKRGRNWKLLAETELLATDGFKVLYSYRELEHPFVGALYSMLYPSYSPSNFFPPLSDEVMQRVPLLRAMGVGYVLSADAAIDASELEPVADIATAAPPFNETAANGVIHVYRVRNALPVAWLSSSASTNGSNQEALRKLVQSPNQFGSLFPAGFRELDGRATVVAETPQSLTVETSSEQPMELVTTWVYRRFWRAYVDGHRYAVKRSHGVFMEVDVPAGTHKVVWRYVPLDAILGCWLSIAVLIGPIAIWLFSCRRRAALP